MPRSPAGRTTGFTETIVVAGRSIPIAVFIARFLTVANGTLSRLTIWDTVPVGKLRGERTDR
ncbi:hypothetical protein GCM10027436_50780 [Actinophytocola sediminis]